MLTLPDAMTKGFMPLSSCFWKSCMNSRDIVQRDRKDLPYNPYKELLCAIVLQAVEDLDSKNEKLRKDAEDWLTSQSSLISPDIGRKIVDERRKASGKSKT